MNLEGMNKVSLHRGPHGGRVIAYGAKGVWVRSVEPHVSEDHRVQYLRTDYFVNDPTLGPVRIYLWNPNFIDAGVTRATDLPD